MKVDARGRSDLKVNMPGGLPFAEVILAAKVILASDATKLRHQGSLQKLMHQGSLQQSA
jgi:hypothetical protein